MFLLSTDYLNSQNIIITHCDKKPRGKVGGSAISVYQALLHPPMHREPGDEARGGGGGVNRLPV